MTKHIGCEDSTGLIDMSDILQRSAVILDPFFVMNICPTFCMYWDFAKWRLVSYPALASILMPARS